MDKSAKAVSITAATAGRTLVRNPTQRVTEEQDIVPDTGDIVAMVQEGSTRQCPRILLGKVLRVNSREQEVLLAHLEAMESKKYRLKVGQSTWTESFHSLVFPIDVEYNNGLYHLRSSPLEIHNIVKKV